MDELSTSDPSVIAEPVENVIAAETAARALAIQRVDKLTKRLGLECQYLHWKDDEGFGCTIRVVHPLLRWEETGPREGRKKFAKGEAARKAWPSLLAALTVPRLPQAVQPSRMDTFGEMIRQHTYAKFYKLAASQPWCLGTEKVLAGLFILDAMTGKTSIISLATGNKGIAGENIAQDGRNVNDCHAEVLCRRGLMRFLYAQLGLLRRGAVSVLEQPERGEGDGGERARLKKRYTLHMFINTAPCGDARVYVRSQKRARKRESNGAVVGEGEEGAEGGDDENKGQLRHKIASGEGTVLSVFPASWRELTGPSRARLRTASCSDKMMKWNCLGMQGSLLAALVQPVYLSSLCVAELYNEGRTRRAMGECGREQTASSSDRLGDLYSPSASSGYRRNEPVCMNAQYTEQRIAPTHSISQAVNWNCVDGTVERLNSATGRVCSNVDEVLSMDMRGEKGVEAVSRLSSHSMFTQYERALRDAGVNLPDKTTYSGAKCANTVHSRVREEWFSALGKCKLGFWPSKPIQMKQFTLHGDS